jgi:cytoplasmic iron level regulating protein YaaA (DUF328/UPF0246 family)
MLLLLSPAKKLDYDSPLHIKKHTQPLFVEQSKALIKVLKTKSAGDIAELMSLSAALSELNVGRYREWKPTFTQENARPAVLAFNGDVYEGLEASSLSAAQLDWAQDHIAILSGLYGVLRPLDLMQPYRLEMGTRLKTPAGKNLYEFWGDRIARYLDERVASQRSRVIVNLASEEYFKAVDLKSLAAPVVQCVFQEAKAGSWKIVSFHAKRARGLMARFVVQHKVNDVAGLQAFDAEGYAYAEAASTPAKLVFRRDLAA